ncbi:unnamed protein product [Ectocarpus sp. CCAP 1310/34]|nr:unnamed protein product [Ectocarpus sp. CCAP 1310/34]
MSRQGARGGKDSDSESDFDLDVTEAGRATLPVQEKAPAAPGNGTGDAGSGVPLSPPSGGGDFDGSSSGSSSSSDRRSSSSSSSSSNNNSDSSSSNAAGDDDGGGGTSGSEPGASGGGGGGGSEPGEDSEQLEEYKFDPADSRYPPGREGRRLLWGASKEGPLRHGLERGRTRRETRELQGPEEPPGPDAEPDAEQALLAEIIVDYVSNSLVRERYDEEQVNIEYRREMHELPYGTELQEEAFGAEAVDDGSSQPLHVPQLSVPSPFGQKPSDVECVPLTYKDVLNSKYKVLWEAAIAKEFDGHKKTGTFSEISGLPEGRKAISAKWIFSHKTNEKGLIVDFKARMVARGFSQIPGVDFHHSSSAVRIRGVHQNYGGRIHREW